MLEWLRSKLSDSDEPGYPGQPPETRESQPIPYALKGLHYPAEPEPEPEPSPLAVINRRWKYTGQGFRSSKEPPKPPRERERPMKLPATPSYKVETIRSQGIPSVFGLVTPGDETAEKIDWEHLQLPTWDGCVADETGLQGLPAFGWATVEQRDWIQELKRQLIGRGEVECRAARFQDRSRLQWVHPVYQEKFGDLDALCWMAARTGMAMYDFNEMMQWERENGVGRGLFDTTGGAYDYRRSSLL